MMPEFCSIVTGYPSQLPRFALTEAVALSYEADDGCTTIVKGFVVGFFYDPNNFADGGWIYMLALYEFNYPHGLSLPHYEAAYEHELRRLE